MVWTFPGGDVLNRFVLICSLILTGAFAQDRQYTSWRDYAGSADSAQYPDSAQVNRSNVSSVAGRLDLPDRRRQEILLQSDRHRWTDVCDGQEQFHRRPGCRDRKRDLDVLARPRTRGSSPIGESTTGKARTAPSGACSLPATTCCARSMRGPAKPILSFGDGGSVDLKARLGTRSQNHFAGAVHQRRAACLKTC